MVPSCRTLSRPQLQERLLQQRRKAWKHALRVVNDVVRFIWHSTPIKNLIISRIRLLQSPWRAPLFDDIDSVTSRSPILSPLRDDRFGRPRAMANFVVFVRWLILLSPLRDGWFCRPRAIADSVAFALWLILSPLCDGWFCRPRAMSDSVALVRWLILRELGAIHLRSWGKSAFREYLITSLIAETSFLLGMFKIQRWELI
jgi:hypothetical protein